MVQMYHCLTCDRLMQAASRLSHEAGGPHQRKAKKSTPHAALYAFFDRYSGFHYERTWPPAKIFNHLRLFYGWKRDCRGMGYKKARSEVCRIILSMFEQWTEPTDDLEVWHSLCQTVGITSLPPSKTQCRKVGYYDNPLDVIYVNRFFELTDTI